MPVSTAPFKRCDCCSRVYTELEWQALHCVGILRIPPDAQGEEDPLPPLELRHCACGSTITVPCPDPEAQGGR